MKCLSGRDFKDEVPLKKVRGLRQIASDLMSSECGSRLMGKGLEWLGTLRQWLCDGTENPS